VCFRWGGAYVSHASLGIDLGGTRIKAVRLSATGEIVSKEIFPTADDGTGAWLATVAGLVREFDGPVGLSAPGLAEPAHRWIEHMPGRLQGLEKFDWTRELNRTVRVWNDAQAALLGERLLGAARGFSDVVLLTLGTGVGGAIISGGRLLHGAIGRAGHLGHMTVDAVGAPDITGTPGSLEDALGDATVRSRTGFPSTQALLEAVAAGDAAASACWHQSVRALAAAIASLGNIVDPEAFVIGGGIASAGPRLFEPLDEFLSGMEWRPAGHRCRVLPAKLGEWAGAVGAAHAASSPTIDL